MFDGFSIKSVHQPARPSAVCPSVRLPVRPSVRPSVPWPVRPSVCPPLAHPSVRPSAVRPFVRLPSVRPSVRPPVRGSILFSNAAQNQFGDPESLGAERAALAHPHPGARRPQGPSGTPAGSALGSGAMPNQICPPVRPSLRTGRRYGEERRGDGLH